VSDGVGYWAYIAVCAVLAAAIISGVVDDHAPEYIKLCNNHPDKDSCAFTIESIRSSYNAKSLTVPKEFNCNGHRNVASKPMVRKPSPPLKASVNARYDNACAMMAALLDDGDPDPDLDQYVETCSRHPDKDSCESTRSFLEQNGKKFPVTCKGGG
jgi:hypothetical protein